MVKKTTILLLALTWWALAQPTVQIQTQEQGYGPTLKTGEEATISYTLTLADGKEVESASERQPYKFIVGDQKVVPGLSEGVQGMKMMETRRITVPPERGYGARSLGVIPPNSTLVFTVKLLNISVIKEESLSQKFQEEDFLEKRNARDITKPAMFEYVIRDFYTKPWRYDDGYIKTLKKCGTLLLVLVVLGFVYRQGLKKGVWVL